MEYSKLTSSERVKMKKDHEEIKTVLSVIIPVYNGEKTISRAIKSIELQPEAQYCEIIVVNDGSSDNTMGVLRELQKIYHNIQVFSKQNSGVSDSRNCGIKNAKGKYLAFLDADDFWGGILEEEIVEEMLSEDIDIFEFSYSNISNSLKYVRCNHVKNEIIEYKTHQRGHYDWRMNSAFIIKRQLVIDNDISYPVCRIAEDTTFMDWCFYYAKKIKKLDKVIYYWVSNPTSVTHTISPIEEFDEKMKSYALSKEWFALHGCEIDIRYGFFMNADVLLKQLCRLQTVYQVKRTISNDNRFNNLRDYSSIGLSEELRKSISMWNKHPVCFWVLARLSDIPSKVYKLLCGINLELAERIAYSARKYTKCPSELAEYINEISV